MMLFISHMIWFVVDGIRGTFWLRFDSILEKLEKQGIPILYRLYLYSVPIV
jgi:hypothetical protein